MNKILFSLVVVGISLVANLEGVSAMEIDEKPVMIKKRKLDGQVESEGETSPIKKVKRNLWEEMKEALPEAFFTLPEYKQKIISFHMGLPFHEEKIKNQQLQLDIEDKISVEIYPKETRS